MKKALTPVAKRLRNEPSEAEKHLWRELRFKSLGVQFRRQAVIGRSIVDGGQHAQNRQDNERDQWLKRPGLGILRFWNNDVLENVADRSPEGKGVFQRIEEHLKFPLPSPPHKVGGNLS